MMMGLDWSTILTNMYLFMVFVAAVFLVFPLLAAGLMVTTATVASKLLDWLGW